MKFKKIKIIATGGVILAILAGVFMWLGRPAVPPQPAATPTDLGDAWITFADPENRFSVALPPPPQTDYSVNVYPGLTAPVQIQTILKSAGGNAKIIYNDSHADANGTPYWDYKITNPSSTYQGRMFLVNHTLYVLMYHPVSKDIDQNGFNTFLSSFQLNP